jgi:hypothetical protein
MADEKRLDTLQDEIKLLKGELKNSLASVRDYLLNMELPSSEFSTILAALSGDDATPQRMNVDGNAPIREPEMPEPTFEEETEDEPEENAEEEDKPGEDEDLLDFEEPETEEETEEEGLPEDSVLEEEGMPEDELLPEGEEVSDELPEENALEEEELPEDAIQPEDEAAETEDEIIPEENEELPELPLEEVLSMPYDQDTNDINKGIPKVNMLANLINWVAKAKQEIGYDELPAFLEVYGISGHLSPELKEVIIHLAEIAKENPEITDSEIWSQSMLSLHGILTGGDAPQNPVIPSWVDAADEAEALAEEEIIEVGKANEKRAQLKLVFPNGNGKNKEFSIDFTPEENGDGES